MAESLRYEAERSAWIKSRRWLDRASARRRAELLARRARQLSRAEAGVQDSALHETETQTTLHRWTRHDDAPTSALGFVAWVLLFCVVGPLVFGVTWAVAWISYRAWELAADRHRVRIWPYALAATVTLAIALVGRPLGWDLWAIFTLAEFIEVGTGGFIAPEALSRWYAAGLISWLQFQTALGFLFAGWLAYAWGWAAPAVRHASRRQPAKHQPAAMPSAGQPKDITKVSLPRRAPTAATSPSVATPVDAETGGDEVGASTVPAALIDEPEFITMAPSTAANPPITNTKERGS